MDAQIAELIQENLEPWPSAWDAMDENKYLALDCYEDTAKMYCDALTQFVVRYIPSLPLPLPCAPHR